MVAGPSYFRVSRELTFLCVRENPLVFYADRCRNYSSFKNGEDLTWVFPAQRKLLFHFYRPVCHDRIVHPKPS